MKTKFRIIIGASALALLAGVLVLKREKVAVEASNQPVATPGSQSARAPSPVASQNAAQQGAAASPGRPFDSMSSSERDSVLDPIGKLSTPRMFQAWIDAGRIDRDPMKQFAIANYLSAALQQKASDPAVYEQMQGYISDISIPSADRGQLLNVLAEAKTKESLDILAQTATTSTDAVLRTTASVGIKTAGSLWGDGTYHEELAPALERVWENTHDQLLLTSTAVAMAKVGAPSSIRLLVSSATASDSRDERRARAAEVALREVLNPHAVPVFAGMLAGQPATSATAVVASGALAAMHAASAARPLLDWLEMADDTAAPLAKAYAAQAHSPALVKAFRAALSPSVQFRSSEVREAIRAGVAQYDSSRKFGQ